VRKLLIILLFAFLPFQISHSQSTTYIDIPYDEKYQPVDIKISFPQLCYARDEFHNSIVVFYNGREIESQIYNLKHIDNTHIKSCNIVFLSQGRGRYVIKYGDEEAIRSYTKHVNVVDRSYSKKLLGYSLNLNYYAIMEDGNCIFSVVQDGNIFGIQMGQKVIKMKEGEKEFGISSWKYMSSFAFFYDSQKEIGTDEKLISKEILVNGNLMTRIKIKSSSDDGSVETTAYYTYYYNPGRNKRIYVDFVHDVKRDCKARGEKNGILAYLMCLKSKSRVINELNMGNILPYIHVYGKNGIEEYTMETEPQNRDYKWLLSSKDNVTLGKKPWFCMDDGEAYGIIMDAKAEGLKIKAVVKKEIDMPGLTIAGGGVSAGIDKALIPKGKYSHKCEVYFGKNLKDFASEADNFYRFYNYRMNEKINVSMHNLSVIVHSFLPVRMRVEICRSGNVVMEKMARFRRAKFLLPDSTYVVKVFAGKKFVGEKFIKLDDDEKLHIWCTFEGKLSIITDRGVEAMLLDGSEIVSKNVSDGHIILKAPLFKTYKLLLIYKGFILEEREVFIPSFPLKINFKFYDFEIHVFDSLNFPCEENLSVSITGKGNTLYGKKDGYKYLFNGIPEGDYMLTITHKNFSLIKDIHIPSSPLRIVYPITYRVKVNVFDSRGIKTDAKIRFERNGKEFKGDIPPGKYNVNIYYGKKVSIPVYVSSDMKMDFVVKKTSFIVYLFIAIILFLALFFSYKKDYLSSIMLSFSLSFISSWWYAGNSKLYIFPVTMIKFHENYGEILSLPSIFRLSLTIVIAVFIFSLILAIMKKYGIAFISCIASLSLFIYSIHRFSEITTGSIYGRGIIEGEYATWGMGIGFYISIIYAILLMGLMINEIRRSS